ncbi:MAG: hypothetical protein LBT30_06495 [Clostridiales bacterium]|jgi:hypothetical protein|nr:hypothetical protein [Clostridiales bacterium]
MDINLIKEQTKLDVEKSRGKFIAGHIIVLLAISIVGVAAYFLTSYISSSGLLTHADGSGPYIFELILIILAAFLLVFLFVYGPAQIFLFGITAKFPLELAYNGNASISSVIYGANLRAYRTMKILLYPIVIGVIAWIPLVLLLVVGFVAPVVGLAPAILTVIKVLQVLALIYALFIYLKFALVRFYIADDDDNTLKFRATLKASWKAMDFASILDYIKLNIIPLLLQIAVFLPFLLTGAALVLTVITLPSVAPILGFEFLANLPIELPAMPSLIPQNLPALPAWLTVNVAASAAAAGAFVSYALYVIFVKASKFTSIANFYNQVK